MNPSDEHPVHADPGTLVALQDEVHVLDTTALTAHARALGVTPPDERPDWYVVLEYNENGVEQGLFWTGPDD
jgi:hypothetical protein